jgi:predicted nuclease of predicted toxin-antitoxin system
MRILADENMPRSLVGLLRERGHDVLSVREDLQGQSDRAVLLRANAEERLIVTQDKDFGELAFSHGMSAKCGVVLFRLGDLDRDETVARMLRVIESRSDWEGSLAVVTVNRIRIRRLSSGIRH